MITEIVTFQLKANASLADSSSPASKVIREFLAPQLAAYGAHDAYYGQFIEKPGTAITFLEWESMDDHKKFVRSPDYETQLDQLRTIINDDTPITALHIPFSPSSNPSPVLGANTKVGATEVAFFYFPPSLTSSDKAAIMSAVDKMRPVLERSEALCVYDGWALEEAVPNPGPQAGGGEMSQVYVNVVGWEDVEAHVWFMGSEDFRRNIHHMLGIGEMRYTEFFHVRLRAV